MNPEELDDEMLTEEWVDVGTYPSLKDAYEHGLVALAMGEAIKVDRGERPGEFDLRVEPEAAPEITEEIAEYDLEQEVPLLPPVLPSNWGKYPAGFLHVLAWWGVLLVVFNWQLNDPSVADRGASSSIGLIGRGEWWRPFTALFLHGDSGHIIGNMGSGAAFGVLVAKVIGPWRGWALILLSGAVGNAMTSWLTYPHYFSSLGASTAVFGALGILSGAGLVENFREPVRMPWLRVLGPLLAGVILLGWLGGAEAGSNTDVFGHVFGFTAGVVAGVLCKFFDRSSETLRTAENEAN